jgi:hypothetical protein
MEATHRVYHRYGASLVEILIAIGIIAILIGLLIPAVSNIREIARVLQTNNHERQLILGVHQLSSTNDELIRSLPKNSPQLKKVYYENSIFRLLVPYVHMDIPYPRPHATREEALQYFNPRIKIYTDPSDPSLYDPFNQAGSDLREGIANRVSYSANMMVFDGFLSMTGSVPDGHSNTIAFTTHYFHCGTEQVTEKWGVMYWDAIIPAPKWGNDRRATFADAGCRDVVPIREPGTGRTLASRRGTTFEIRPPVTDADCRMPHALYSRGIQVAMFDGSVRTIRPTVDETVFWSLVTPNWGEVVSLPD